MDAVVEIFFSFAAVIALFMLVGPTRAALVGMPLLIWLAYRLGRGLRYS